MACPEARPALGERADPDALGGLFAQMDARGAMAGDGERHGLVVFALMDAQARAGTQIEVDEKFEEVGILFVNAQDFVIVSHLSF